MTQAMAEQERFFTENNTYQLPFNRASEQGFYNITAAACPGATITNCVLLTATPNPAQPAQVPDGNLTLNSRGQKLPADHW
ncbi:MAG: type IV pilin protein [Chromatiales bacterium]|nr:type IV pilin protein [Chromatiales bacterium]